MPTISERTFAGHLNLTQIIWSDPAWANYSIAKDLQQAKIQELVRVRLNVGLDAAAAYINVLRANTLLLVQRQNLTFSKVNLERAQVRVDASIKAQNREHSQATRSFWSPTVGLNGSLNHLFDSSGAGSDPIPGMEPMDTTWGFSVFLSLPILEGGGRFAETRRTTQEIMRLERGRIAAAERIEEEVRSAVIQAVTGRLSIDLSRQAAEAAKLNLQIISDNYTLGRAQLVDLIDAQTNALNSELSAADAVYAQLLNLMRVERAVGKFTFFVEAEGRAVWLDELDAFAAGR